MTPERPPSALLARLQGTPGDGTARVEHSGESPEESPQGGEEPACTPELAERLAVFTRACRGARLEWVAGCPVAVHPSGRAFAAAYGTAGLLVATAEPPGALTAKDADPGPGPPWTALNPWAADVTFARAADLLRQRVQRAFAAAGGTGEAAPNRA